MLAGFHEGLRTTTISVEGPYRRKRLSERIVKWGKKAKKESSAHQDGHLQLTYTRALMASRHLR